MAATLHAEVQFDQQGHLIIPVELMQAISAEKHPLIARVENDCLILEKRETIRQRIKARFSCIPQDVSLADELIAERKQNYWLAKDCLRTLALLG